MSGYFQTFVVLDAVDDALAERVVDPLVARGVFLAQVNGEHPAGPAHETIVVAQGHHPRGRLVVRRGDGTDGRGVFGTGGAGTRCPACAYTLEIASGDREAWNAAITAWWRGHEGSLACPRCDVVTAVVDWPADEPLGFGYLGFELWDFARLDEAFVAEMKRAIGGRVTLICGKL